MSTAAKLTIAKITSNIEGRDQMIRIVIVDLVEGRRCEALVSPEDFTLAAVGNQEVPCALEYRMLVRRQAALLRVPLAAPSPSSGPHDFPSPESPQQAPGTSSALSGAPGTEASAPLPGPID